MEGYPDGVNAYICERVRGSMPPRPGSSPRLIPRPLGRHAAKLIAYSLADLLRWAATASAHPNLGVIGWRDIRSWHVTELYQDALTLGFWSENYFATRTPSPLHPNTVRTRVSEALGCYAWMASEGYVPEFDYDPGLRTVQLSKDSALLSYRAEMTQVTVATVPTRARRIRRAPGDMPLPSLEHLTQFFEALPAGAHRLAALQIFETGMRAEEVVENTLIPGQTHQRDTSNDAWCVHPDWPPYRYPLSYSLSDNRMLGVIPSREMAWDIDARGGYQCEYRIIGKGPKIRKVHLPPKLLQAIWTHIDGGRDALVLERLTRHERPLAHVYLNRFGDKLGYHAIWEACDRVNKKLRRPIDLTPHTLRHAYACYFLEAGLREEARRRSIDPDNIPLEILREHGETILLTIKEDLGHAEYETTRRYLTMIIAGRFRLKYHATWNAFLDGVGASVDG